MKPFIAESTFASVYVAHALSHHQYVTTTEATIFSKCANSEKDGTSSQSWMKWSLVTPQGPWAAIEKASGCWTSPLHIKDERWPPGIRIWALGSPWQAPCIPMDSPFRRGKSRRKQIAPFKCETRRSTKWLVGEGYQWIRCARISPICVWDERTAKISTVLWCLWKYSTRRPCQGYKWNLLY